MICTACGEEVHPAQELQLDGSSVDICPRCGAKWNIAPPPPIPENGAGRPVPAVPTVAQQNITEQNVVTSAPPMASAPTVTITNAEPPPLEPIPLINARVRWLRSQIKQLDGYRKELAQLEKMLGVVKPPTRRTRKKK